MRQSVVVILAVAALTLTGCSDGDEFPYTSQQMTNADIKCDGEMLDGTLVGAAPRPGSDAWSEAHVDCLRDRLPELSNQQITHLADTIAAAREYEQQQ
jgi:hypothetical protein